mgnify:CR=1 FL=1
MKKCSDCNRKMKELTGRTPEGVNYNYFKCEKCGEEILDMEQLHNVAEKYGELRRYHAKMSKWGKSLGLRIPKALVNKYKFRDEEEVTIIPEDKGIRIIPGR